jgi:hypothetical protein
MTLTAIQTPRQHAVDGAGFAAEARDHVLLPARGHDGHGAHARASSPALSTTRSDQLKVSVPYKNCLLEQCHNFGVQFIKPVDPLMYITLRTNPDKRGDICAIDLVLELLAE